CARGLNWGDYSDYW
nr:immunoglobulin heavy chain junction region [Macaca mulatta]